MALHEADREYGPTPENAAHEHTDIEPAIATKFAIWLTIAMVISAAIVYGTFWFFEGRAQTADRQALVFPLAAGQVKQAPAPNLQTQPFKDIYQLRQSEADKLGGYGWVDKGSGTARIPVDEAMRLMIERSLLPARPGAESGATNAVGADSSAGRTQMVR
jgi:hypothetical protein